MLRSAHSEALWLACVTLVALSLPAQTLTREGSRWVQTITGSAPAAGRLRINTQGPVHLEGRAATEITYTAKLSVQVRSEEDARRVFSRYALRVAAAGDLVVLTGPGGPVLSNLTVKAPRLNAAVIITTDGAVEANGIDGSLEVSTGAGEVKCDRIRGDSVLSTGGGDIHVGEVGGDLRSGTAGGSITVKNVHGEAVLQTAGGDVDVTNAGSAVRVDTSGGAIRVNSAGGAVSASTGGGSIVVGKAGGIVTARNMAGPVQVGAAAGVRCESGTGGIKVSNISGPMRVSTTVGSIVASLLSGRPLSDSFLATGDGDITALIPSNVGVTIQAESDRRIISDFPGVTVRLRGPLVVAEGAVNGGGPVLRISGAGGIISIKRQ